MIEGIAGVIVWTDDLDKLKRFYKDVMRFPVHSERPYFVAFEWGAMRFSIGLHDRVHGWAAEPERMMVNLAVSDIDAEYERLMAEGVRFSRPPEQEHWGGWVATLQDPDGNTLQLLQQPEQQ
jgi:predicted enzyme related to lactoylglutathione lyase